MYGRGIILDTIDRLLGNAETTQSRHAEMMRIVSIGGADNITNTRMAHPELSTAELRTLMTEKDEDHREKTIIAYYDSMNQKEQKYAKDMINEKYGFIDSMTIIMDMEAEANKRLAWRQWR